MPVPAVRPGPVHVRVPATCANLGPGFDALGLAVSLHDEITVSVSPGGLVVEVSGEGARTVPRDESHLVVRALRAGFDHLGVSPPGLHVRCRNRVPHGRGLGSSAAAVVGGLVAARALVTGGAERLDDAALLALATAMEGHPDNVAACLHGGLTVAWVDVGGVWAVRTDPDRRIVPVLFVPEDPMATGVARGLLPRTVPHADAAANAGRAALLVQALTTRPDLLLPATDDRLHQPYRAAAMPATAALVSHLRAGGVAAVVSGAGPAVLALTTDAASLVAGVDPGAGWATLTLAMEPDGAVVSGGHREVGGE